MSDLTVAIMAGGKSSRMGADKAFVQLLGKPLVEHLLDRVSDLGQDATLIITNQPAAYAHLALPVYPDVFPGKGSLGGIYTALHHSKSAYTLVLACDMPFANPALLRHMIGLRDADGGPFDVIAPRVDGHPQGLHAIYRNTCLAPIRRDILADRLKVIGFYDAVRARYLDEAECHPFDPSGHSLYNINTPEELAAAQRLIEVTPPGPPSD